MKRTTLFRLFVIFTLFLSGMNAMAAITGTIDGNRAICSGGTLSLTANLTNGSSTLQYQFSVDGTIKQAYGSSNVFSYSGATSSFDVRVEVRDTGSSDTYDSGPLNIVVHPKPTLTVTDPAPACAPDKVSIVQPPALGVTYYYYTDAGMTSPVVSPDKISTTGTYYIVKSENGCNSDPAQINVTIHPQPDFNPIAPGPECSPATASIIQLPEAGYEFTYYAQNQTTELSAAYAADIPYGGEYYITKKDLNTGCVSEKKKVLVRIDAVLQFDPVSANLSACTPNTVTLEQPADPGYMYEYYNSSHVPYTDDSYKGISASGSYYVRKKSLSVASCLSNMRQITVSIGNTPTANAGADREVCKGGQTVLGSSTIGGVSYSWAPTSGLSSSVSASPTATIINDVTYVLTVTDMTSKCVARDTVKIEMKELPIQYNVSRGTVEGYCANTSPVGTQIRLDNSQTGVDYYLYKDGVAVGAPQPGTNNTPLDWWNQPKGVYTVVAKTADALECTQKMNGSATIVEYPLPTATISASGAICENDSVEITIKFSGIAPFEATYIDPFSTSKTITTVGSQTEYKFKVTSTASGLWQITSVKDARCTEDYTINPKPSVNISVSDMSALDINTSTGLTTICEGDSLVLIPTIQDPSLQYLWSTGEALVNAIVSPKITTTYHLTIKDQYNCYVRDTIEITVLPLPVIDFTGPNFDQAACLDNTTVIPLLGDPSGGIFTGPNVNSSTSTYTPAAVVGDYDSITYTYRDVNGCVSELTKRIYVNNIPEVDWYVPPALGYPTDYDLSFAYCQQVGDSIHLQGTPSDDGISDWKLYTGPGDPGDLIKREDGEAVLINLKVGTYHIEYFYTDNKGCISSKLKTLTINPSDPDPITMLPIIMPDTLCGSDTLVKIIGGTVGGWFDINDPSLIVSQVTGEIEIDPSKAKPGEYTLRYTIIDSKSCDHHVFKKFWIQSPIKIKELTIPKKYCSIDDPVALKFTASVPVSGSVTINRTSAPTATVLNNIPDTDIANMFFHPSWGPGDYEIIYSYTDGKCPGVYTYKVRVDDIPTINMNLVKRDYCYGDVVSLNAQPNGGRYSTSNNNVGLVGSNFYTTQSGTGQFTIYYEYNDSNVCPGSDSVKITVRGKEPGDMQILGLNSVYCETQGTVSIEGAPKGANYPHVPQHVAYFDQTNFITNTGDGTAEIDLSKTNSNSTYTATFNFKEYYYDYYGVLDSCIHSVSKNFTVLGKTVSFSGFNDGDVICNTADPILLQGNESKNAKFTINSYQGIGLTDRGDGTAIIYPNLLDEQQYEVTYTVSFYNSKDSLLCDLTTSKSFSILPVRSMELKLVCSGNKNTFQIQNALPDHTYELWVNGALYNTVSGATGVVDFLSLSDAYTSNCYFYVNRGACRMMHPDKYELTPLKVTIGKLKDISCHGTDDGELTTAIRGGNTPYVVEWFDSSTNLINTSATSSNLPADTYTATVTDSIGCTATDTYTLTEPTALIVAIANQTNLLCFGASDGNAKIIASGGKPSYEYYWLDENNDTISRSSEIAGVKAGTYRVFVKDRGGCEVSTSVYIPEATQLTFAETHVNVGIYGQSTGSIDITVGGGTPYLATPPPYRYEWSGPSITALNKNDEDLTALKAGTYFIKVTDSLGCQLNESVVITQPEVLIVKDTIIHITCYDKYGPSNDGSIDLMVSGGQAPYYFEWEDDLLNPIANGTGLSKIDNLAPGTYHVKITDAASAEFNGTYIVNGKLELAIHTLGATRTDIKCHGDKTGVLYVDGRNGTPFTDGYRYKWIAGTITGVDTNPYQAGLGAGVYEVEVRDSLGCYNSEIFTITQPANPLQVSLTSNDPSCFNSDDGSIALTVTGGTPDATPPGYEFIWGDIGIITNPNRNNLYAGTYDVTVKDANSCYVQASATLVNPKELTISISGVSPVCSGGNAELQFTMNDFKDWTIVYSTDGGLTTHTVIESNSVVTVLHPINQSTTFTIIDAYDQQGCHATISNTSNKFYVQVSQNPDITLLETSLDICSGEKAEIPFSLVGSSSWDIEFRDNWGGTYSVNSTSVNGVFEVHPSVTTTYTVISVSSNGCVTTKSDQAVVNVHGAPQLGPLIIHDPLICMGEEARISIEITGDAPWIVYYTENGIDKNIMVASSPDTLRMYPDSTTTYVFYKLRSTYGCERTISQQRQVMVRELPERPLEITGKNLVCVNTTESYFVPPAQGASSYKWTVPPGATITGSDNGYSIMVDFGPTAQSGLVTVAGVNDCGNSPETSKYVTVNQLAGDAGQIVVADTLCQGQEFFYISVPVIDHATNYVWSLPYGFTIMAGAGTNNILVSLDPAVTGGGVIEVYGENMCNKGASSTKDVYIKGFAKVEAGPDQYTMCKDYATMRADAVTPDVGTWRIIQGYGEFEDVNDPRTKVNKLALGENIFQWEVSNNICVKSDVVYIINNSADAAVPEITSDYIFCEDSITLRAKEPLAGIGKWEFVSGDGNIDDADNHETKVRNLAFGKNVFRWKVTNGQCSKEAYVNIFSETPKNYAYAGEDDLIFVDSVKIHAKIPGNGIIAKWEVISGTGVLQNATDYTTMVHNLSAGINTFRWTVKYNDCEASDEVTIRYVREPIAKFVVDTVAGCIPFKVAIRNQTIGNANYYWDFGDGATSTVFNPAHIYTQPGKYKIILKAEGPDKTDFYSVTVEATKGPEVVINVLTDTLYLPNANLMLLNGTVDASKYEWSFGDGATSTEYNPGHKYTEAGWYYISLVATGMNNCIDSAETRVYVKESKGFVTFPNAFVPNPSAQNDGSYSLIFRNHDVFYPIWEDVVEYKLEIFNRWGEKVFESNDINIGWNGYVKNKLAPVGMYVFKATGKFRNGSSFSEKGEVVLVQ